MKLRLLADRLLIKQIEGDDAIEITGMEFDSRKVSKGDLFICLTGSSLDGHCYIEEAIQNGAAALLIEKDVTPPVQITTIKVPNTRRAMAVLADYFYGHPSHQLKLIGVTGTNGKTTTTHLIEKILNHYSTKAGLIGTLYMRFDELSEKTSNTTPDSLELQRYLKQMVELGAEYAVLEVSSHALDKGRVNGCHFKHAVFTNLTHDHLDYHQTMENYANVKSLLFSQLGNKYESSRQVAVLNADDPSCSELAKKTAAEIVTYGIDQKADIHAEHITMRSDGTYMDVVTFKGRIPLRLKLLGKFNIYNVLAALSVCLVENIPLDQIKRSVESFSGVPGRFEPIYFGQDFTIIVDYAHNPDGLENVLKTAKEMTKGKLYCVCGCEGDKDRQKRPLMGKIAVTYSDLAIFTSDNSRSEEPEDIISEMIAGLRLEQISGRRYVPMVNRKEAISYALKMAGPNDCVVIAGRGHETHMIVKNEAIPFDDKTVIKEALAILMTV